MVMPLEGLGRTGFWGIEGTAFVPDLPFAVHRFGALAGQSKLRIYATHPFGGNLAKYAIVWGPDNAHDV